MDLSIRPMTPQERLYAYPQSTQIDGQTGGLGCYRLSFGEDGYDFLPSWEGTYRSRNNESLRVTSDELIDKLRFDRSLDKPLEHIKAMASYCEKHPEAAFGDEGQFAFRVDVGQYAYMLRMDPQSTDHNLYCYCYERRWLDHHLEQAARGIRFIDPGYKELFRILDGDMIRIIWADGTHFDKTCRYIDDYHLEVHGRESELFHICQFAEIMERNGNTVIPLRSSLPDKCYCVLPGSDEIIIAKKGETGYYRTDNYGHDREDALRIVAELNEQGGVTKAQAEAMLAGSMFGWACPAADPKNYDADGRLIKPKHQDRGDAR